MLLVCCHKEYDFYNSDVHVPIQVGTSLAKTSLDVRLHDNEGENISELNKSFCELTALYWGWKNCISEGDAIWGIEHYRRYFASPSIFHKIIYSSREKFRPLEKAHIRRLLKGYDIILAKPEKYPVRIYSDYAMKHERKDIEVLRSVVVEIFPDCISSYDEVIWNNNKLSPYNMFISNKEIYDDYCEWLFKILFEVRRRIDISLYDSYQARIFGFMSERLLNVFVHYKKYKVRYLPVAFLDEKPSFFYRLGKRVLDVIDSIRFCVISRKK